MGSLNKKRALVTAGAQGIGMAISRELLNQGCDVSVHYHTSSEGAAEIEEYASSLSRKYGAVQGDLTAEEDVQRVVSESADMLGGLDILINNTGSLVERRSLDEIDTEYWRNVIDINMHSMIMVTREAVPYLEKNTNSSIVNLSSLAGRKGGHSGSMVYAAAKGAVLAWTRGLAEEIGRKGIRVNSVAPGLIPGACRRTGLVTADRCLRAGQGVAEEKVAFRATSTRRNEEMRSKHRQPRGLWLRTAICGVTAPQ